MDYKATKIAISIAIILFASAATAQKLPNKQEGNVHAPTGIKIDGKATEWGNKFQAYNHAIDVYYTVANDDDNLYLIVQATNGRIINRIMAGGVTFAVNASDRKDDKNSPAITFPVFDRSSRFSMGDGGKAAVDQLQQGFVEHQDSVAKAYNKRLWATSKYVMVTGIKGIDTLISVYNDLGIKAAHLFDNNMAHTYELAIPLKDVGLSVNEPVKFAYHITLNGVSILTKTMNFNADRSANANTGGSDNGLLEAKVALASQSSAPTDVWGEYTLVKN